MTTAVNLVDNNNSDSNDKSETPRLVDHSNDDDDADGDEKVINHVLVPENANYHMPFLENINLGRQETVNLETNTNVTPGGRTQIVSPATTGITTTAVEQLAMGHTLDDKGGRHTTRTSKKPKN